MEAVILAAGNGSRLSSVANGGSKCLANLGGISILEYQLGVLRDLAVKRIIVVVGHDAASVESRLGSDCVVVQNPRYSETNSLYSLSLVLNHVRDDFLLANCDVVADQRIYRRLIDASGSALAFDSGSGTEAEQMKVARAADGGLRALGKDLPAEIVHGESLGLLKFSANALPALLEEVGNALWYGGEGQWAPAAFDRLARREHIECMDVAGYPWAEIDFPEDLEYARSMVWPRLSPVGIAGPPMYAGSF